VVLTIDTHGARPPSLRRPAPRARAVPQACAAQGVSRSGVPGIVVACVDDVGRPRLRWRSGMTLADVEECVLRPPRP
jgi:hypothetical protein